MEDVTLTSMGEIDASVPDEGALRANCERREWGCGKITDVAEIATIKGGIVLILEALRAHHLPFRMLNMPGLNLAGILGELWSGTTELYMSEIRP